MRLQVLFCRHSPLSFGRQDSFEERDEHPACLQTVTVTYLLGPCIPPHRTALLCRTRPQKGSRLHTLTRLRSHNHLGTAEQTTEPLRHRPMADWLPLVRQGCEAGLDHRE